MLRLALQSTLFPYTTLFRSVHVAHDFFLSRLVHASKTPLALEHRNRGDRWRLSAAHWLVGGRRNGDGAGLDPVRDFGFLRSEERRVGKEGRVWVWWGHGVRN